MPTDEELNYLFEFPHDSPHGQSRASGGAPRRLCAADVANMEAWSNWYGANAGSLNAPTALTSTEVVNVLQYASAQNSQSFVLSRPAKRGAPPS